MTNILHKIVATKRQEVEQAIRLRPLQQVLEAIQNAPPPRDFLTPLQSSPPIRLIAEVKQASPSKGIIRQDFDPCSIALAYAEAGASCISVLTDERYFKGSLEFLSNIRQVVAVPLLRKDFIIDPYQVYEARAHGADAILLIAECLTPQQLKDLRQLAYELGMQSLVEIYQEANLQHALDSGTQLIGVNNRDLTTFEVDLQRTIRLRAAIPQTHTLVGESGIAGRADALLLEEHQVQAMLVGESLMRQPDLRLAVRQLLGLEA